MDNIAKDKQRAGKPNSNAWGYVNSNTRNGFVVNNGSVVSHLSITIILVMWRGAGDWWK